MAWFSKKSASTETESAAKPPESKPTPKADADVDSVVGFIVQELINIAELQGGIHVIEGDIDLDVDMYSAGYIDSMAVTDLLLNAETKYGVSLPHHIVGGDANTVRLFAAHIVSLLA